MERKVGLWIDHRKAIIVSIKDDLEEIKSVTSDMEKHVRFSGGAEKDSEEDQMDRRFTSHLNKYYDKIISLIRDVSSVLILGPGEAKVEFKKRFESEMKIGSIVDIETADKMSVPQIAARVRGYCSKKSVPLL